MITIDTREQNTYSPLIPIMRAICSAEAGECIQVTTDNEAVFKDLKEYLSEQNVGFREIYDEEKMTLQFIVPPAG